MIGIFGGETLEEIISSCEKVLSHSAKLPPFYGYIFGEAQESVLELVAKTLASIRTGALLVAALLRRHVPVPSVVLCDFALCFQKLQRHPQHCCRQH